MSCTVAFHRGFDGAGLLFQQSVSCKKPTLSPYARCHKPDTLNPKQILRWT